MGRLSRFCFISDLVDFINIADSFLRVYFLFFVRNKLVSLSKLNALLTKKEKSSFKYERVR